MHRVLTNFIQALRNADVRISPAETLDALRTAELVGYADRTLLKRSLSLVLPKTLDEKAVFDTCFDQFFASRESNPIEAFEADDAQGSPNIGPDSNVQEPGSGDTSGGRARGTAQPTAADAQSADAHASTPYDPNGASSALGQMLLRGNRVEIGVAISNAGRQVGIERIELFTQKGIYSRRILEAMGLVELQSEISSLESSAEPADRRLGHELGRRRDWLREEVRAYVEQQFLLHADVTGRRLRDDLLRTVRLSALDQQHRRHVEDIVRRMARRLITNHSHRRRTFKRGQLHVPRTLRRNMKYDDAIFDLQWKSEKIARPKVFAICDVSGSVAEYARFMLTFLYSLEEVLPKVRAFAFSSHLGEVTESFEENPLERAIALTLAEYGGGATDYGQAFVSFADSCLDDIDRRSTVILLGDARNNNGDLQLEVLKKIYERCGRLIWLNPEPRSMWNTGDSEMRHVSVYCHQVEEC
ncbi:MAG TPA: VWA domain-containing protein, partial [Steroidobacteraceae bacterium]